MAHALVMALMATSGSEEEAFTAFHQYFPGAALLIDTYDAVAAAKMLAQKIQAGELRLSGVRLDSGDLVRLSQEVRSLLPGVPIFASGDLDEWEIAKFKRHNACIDGYGLGTRLVTGEPVSGVYKLVEIDGIPTMKQSSNKATYPGRKQIFRRWEKGEIISDQLGLMSEIAPGEQPLLQLFVKQGKRVQPKLSLREIRDRTSSSVASLPTQTRQIQNPIQPTVEISTALRELTEQTKR